jgi:photosystem II stability/assembly factor-like uncharacterized protein
VADLNERLRSHLARVIATPAEAGLEDRITRRFRKGSTPRRPTWIGQVLVAGALVAIAGAVFFGLRASRENVLIKPNPTPTAKPTPTPSASAVPAGEPTFGIVHMITAQVGWAMSEHGVLRTTDAWAHWATVGPPGVTGLGAGAQFISGTEAWVVSGNPQTPRASTIFHTTDGGASWSAVPLLDPSAVGPGEPDFIDAAHGWLFVSYGVAAGSEGGAIYRTIDGGAHWTKVEQTVGGVQEAPGSLPFSCDKAGISFINATTGWASGICAGGPPYFYVSHDAGRTWTSQPLPLPDSLAQQSEQWSASVPVFFDARSGYFILTGSVALLYTTSDAGTTWTSHSLPLGGWSKPVGALAFSSLSDGWLISSDGALVYRTSDGGQRWTSLRPLPPLTGLQSVDVIDMLRAIAVLNPSGSQSVLRVTNDGGHAWTQVLP